MKSFSLHSVTNLQALQPSLIELHGHRVALPAVSSHEPLLRGCNQKEWLERLVALGMRHLIVPLNGAEEDACLYARRHPSESESAGGRDVIYNLWHRDEGVFARLQFLLQAADSIGVLVGLSLFDASFGHNRNPFQKDANEQQISFEVLHRKGGTTLKATKASKQRAARREDLEKALINAVDWIGAEMRGRQGVWVELFRSSGPAAELSSPVKQLEAQLMRRMVSALARSTDNPKKMQSGPWFVAPEGFDLSGMDATHASPFRLRPGSSPERELNSLEMFQSNESGARQPVLCRMPGGRRNSADVRRAPQRAALWRAVMQGCWPVVAFGFSRQDYQRPWKDMAQIATFCRQWVGSGYLRPCPELLRHVSASSRGKISAATDGAGRYFVFLHNCSVRELELSPLPGTYRFYWFEPSTGRGLDHGDGIDGGTKCFVPGPANLREALLVLEQDELPEPLTVW